MRALGLAIVFAYLTLLTATAEAQEGRNAYVERRKPDFKKFPRRP